VEKLKEVLREEIDKLEERLHARKNRDDTSGRLYRGRTGGRPRRDPEASGDPQ
jgi:hypothetical protein